ncbi:MAG: glycosyltransferase family 2 protein [Bacteroidales bacterium]|nr:glycosyltransferase family 2 protein [Bacteroidales bacterium]
MKPISGIITTLNEESNIEEAIRSLQQVCDEVVVVDSLSSDRTCQLAEQAGAKVVIQPYLGDGIQKNVALNHVKNLWVLSIDADERLTPELVDFIEKTDFESTTYDGFALRRRNYVGSRWIKCCRWYPDYLVRLYRHDRLRFCPVKQHSHVPTENTLRVKADLIHYRYKNCGELFAKPERNYSSRGAKILYLSGKKVHAWSPAAHGIGAFLVNYFLRGGILGGVDGLTLTLSIAQNSYLKYAKVLEWQRDEKVRSQENFEKVW